MKNRLSVMLACFAPFMRMEAAESTAQAAQEKITPAESPATASSDEASDWEAVMESVKAPPIPKEWSVTEPSKEDFVRFKSLKIGLALKAADKAGEFYTRYPSSTNAVEARITQYRLINAAIGMGETNQNAMANSLELKLIADKSIPEDRRLEVAVGGAQRRANLKSDDGREAFLGELEKGVRQVRHEFPDRPEGFVLMAQMVQFYSQDDLAEPAVRLARELDQAPVSDELKKTVQLLVRRFEFIGKPFDFKAKSVSGSEIDVSRMRGKVILIDFWASWCEPCLISIPVLKNAYGQFRSKGFEIIGVNLDEDRESMNRVLKKLEMTWPQLFDGLGKPGPIPTKYGVNGIPSMWLIDKQGVLREVIQGISSDPAQHGEFIKKIDALMKEPRKT